MGNPYLSWGSAGKSQLGLATARSDCHYGHCQVQKKITETELAASQGERHSCGWSAGKNVPQMVSICQLHSQHRFGPVSPVSALAGTIGIYVSLTKPLRMSTVIIDKMVVTFFIDHPTNASDYGCPPFADRNLQKVIWQNWGWFPKSEFCSSQWHRDVAMLILGVRSP